MSERECICPYTPPEMWLSAASCGYGGGYEPGSMQEWDPDCPVHPPIPLASEAVVAIFDEAERVTYNALSRGVGTPDIEAVVKVLAEHEDATGWVEDANDNLLYECGCGDRSQPLARSGYGITEAHVQQAAQWHRAHVAAAVLARSVR